MADAVLCLPKTAGLGPPVRLGNGRQFGSRVGIPYHGAQIRVLERSSFSRMFSVGNTSTSTSSRFCIGRELSGCSGSFRQKSPSAPGFGFRAGVWSERQRRELSDGRRGGGIRVRSGGEEIEEISEDVGTSENIQTRRVAGKTGASPSQGKDVSLGLLLGGVALALGFGFLRLGRPAYAENFVAPPTITTPLNNYREVEVIDSSELDTESKQLAVESKESDDGVVDTEAITEAKVQVGGKEGELDEDFEPPYGEGSDLTTDPAEILLRSFLEKHPTDRKALQALLFLRLKKGEVKAALPVVYKLIELEPENLEWKYVRAQADEFAGDVDQARRGFEEILQIKPLSARAWQGLAVIMHKTGENEQAVQRLTGAVQAAVDAGQSTEAVNLRMLLGQLHTMQGDLEKAMELYKTVTEEDPEDYRPYLCQGLVYSIIGEEAKAEKCFRQYRKLCPKDFPQRGFLDDLLLKAKSESGKLNKRIEEEEELKKRGRKPPKMMQQPLAAGRVSKEARGRAEELRTNTP